MNKKVTYNFPKNSIGPFNIESENSLFVNANGLSNLGKDLSNFTVQILSKHIPMGYKTIIICQRLEIWQNGNRLKTWTNTELDNSAKFCAISNTPYEFNRLDWSSKIETETLFKPNSIDTSLRSSTWDKIDQCRASAKAHSAKHSCAVIVSRIVDSISWH
jgi:hypothetical protein